MEEQCSICFENFVDKSYLSTCLHTFCFECINKWWFEKSREQLSVQCPLCKRESELVFHNYDEEYNCYDKKYFDPNRKSFPLTKEHRFRLECYKNTNPSSSADNVHLTRFWKMLINEKKFIQPWLTRELQALTEVADIDPVVLHVVGTIDAFCNRLEKRRIPDKKIAELRQTFRNVISEAACRFVGTRTARFVNELELFLLSRLNIRAYDDLCKQGQNYPRENIADSDITLWVTERLKHLLQDRPYSVLVSPCIELALGVTTSPLDLVRELVDKLDFPPSDANHSFATELFEKVSRNSNPVIKSITPRKRGDKTMREVLEEMEGLFPPQSIADMLELLYALGAINKEGLLTKSGAKMSELPVEPRVAKMIICSEKYGCSEEIITIASMVVAVRGLDYQNFDNKVSDHLAMLDIYDSWRETNFSEDWCSDNQVNVSCMQYARSMRKTLKKILGDLQIEVSSNRNDDAITKCIISGFFMTCATLSKDGSYQSLKRPYVKKHIDSSSTLYEVILKPKFVVYSDLSSPNSMRQVTGISPTLLSEIAPHFYQIKDIRDDTDCKMPKGMGRAPGLFF